MTKHSKVSHLKIKRSKLRSSDITKSPTPIVETPSADGAYFIRRKPKPAKELEEEVKKC